MKTQKRVGLNEMMSYAIAEDGTLRNGFCGQSTQPGLFEVFGSGFNPLPFYNQSFCILIILLCKAVRQMLTCFIITRSIGTCIIIKI